MHTYYGIVKLLFDFFVYDCHLLPESTVYLYLFELNERTSRLEGETLT